MGAGASAPSAEAEAFASSYAALPDDVHDMVEALCEKDSMALLKPNLAAPPPFPPTLCVLPTGRLRAAFFLHRRAARAACSPRPP